MHETIKNLNNPGVTPPEALNGREFNKMLFNPCLILRDMALLEVAGPERTDFLNMLSSNVLPSGGNSGTETLFLNSHGQILSRALYLNFLNSSLLVYDSSAKEVLPNWIRRYERGEETNLKDMSDEFQVLEIFGERGTAVVSSIAGDIEELKPCEPLRTSFAELEIIVLKKPMLCGNMHYWVIYQKKNSDRLLGEIMESTEIYEPSLVSTELYQLYRKKNLEPSDSIDYENKIDPYQAGLESMLSMEKKYFMGKAALLALGRDIAYMKEDS